MQQHSMKPWNTEVRQGLLYDLSYPFFRIRSIRKWRQLRYDTPVRHTDLAQPRFGVSVRDGRVKRIEPGRSGFPDNVGRLRRGNHAASVGYTIIQSELDRPQRQSTNIAHTRS